MTPITCTRCNRTLHHEENPYKHYFCHFRTTEQFYADAARVGKTKRLLPHSYQDGSVEFKELVEMVKLAVRGLRKTQDKEEQAHQLCMDLLASKASNVYIFNECLFLLPLFTRSIIGATEVIESLVAAFSSEEHPVFLMQWKMLSITMNELTVAWLEDGHSSKEWAQFYLAAEKVEALSQICRTPVVEFE